MRLTLLRVGLLLLVFPLAACGTGTVKSGPCFNVLYPLAAGRQWKYNLDQQNAKQTALLSVTGVTGDSASLDFIDESGGSPSSFIIHCTDGALTSFFRRGDRVSFLLLRRFLDREDNVRFGGSVPEAIRRNGLAIFLGDRIDRFRPDHRGCPLPRRDRFDLRRCAGTDPLDDGGRRRGGIRIRHHARRDIFPGGKGDRYSGLQPGVGCQPGLFTTENPGCPRTDIRPVVSAGYRTGKTGLHFLDGQRRRLYISD
jgi:hypothetical protein